MATPKDKYPIITDSGDEAIAAAPVIVSASRSTDIPAFYSDWFFHRLNKGYSAWINVFNGKKYYISYHKTRFIVFWSKNPFPLLRHIDFLRKRQTGCYIHFTLNDYEKEGLEKRVPKLEKRIETFKTLVDVLGKGSVIWRFDPLILTDSITPEILLERIGNIGNLIHDYCEKLVFSFADILQYAKVKRNLEKNNILYKDWTIDQMTGFCQKLVELNRGWNLKLASCGEAHEFTGIEHNRCIDDKLILRLSKNPAVWDFLEAKQCPGPDLFGNLPKNAIKLDDGSYAIVEKNNRDNGQRSACCCAKSKDIGQYNTCPHLCEYCYANNGKKSVSANHARHLRNPCCDLIACK